MRSDVISLLSMSRTQNSFGGWEETPVSVQIPCRVESVSRTEFFEAAKAGMRPEWRFTVFSGDYHGETECDYKGSAYSIYRTFHGEGDFVELYVQAKVGVTHG